MNPEAKQRKRARGTGRIYLRGSTWWIDFWHRGKQHRESSESTKPSDASALLKKRLGEIGRGRLLGPAQEKITFEMLAADFLAYRALRAKEAVRLDAAGKSKMTKSEKQARQRVRHLRRFFGDDRAVDITTDRIRAFQSARLKEGAKPATVNRDCAALSKMFSLAVQAGRLSVKPYIPHLEESRPRQGFFEYGEYLAVREHLTEAHQDVLDFMYLAGWRASEVLLLEWSDVDMAAGVIRLRPELSKNREGRVLALAGPLLEVIERRKMARVLTTPRIFHFRGKEIRCWRKRWGTACEDAGVAGMLRHDLRRTAVRNLTRAGVPERVAMGVTGHKTRSVFDRYNIVSEDDTRQAMARVGAYVETLGRKSKVQPAASPRKRKTRN